MVILIFTAGSKTPSYDLIPGYQSEQECTAAIQGTIVKSEDKLLVGHCFKEAFLKDFLQKNHKEEL
jgi:hypothetical protein